MTDHLPFLRGISAAPHDDLPRLVYADFLEESGEAPLVARAHFIRSQIALAHLAPSVPDYRPTFDLTERLFEQFSNDWLNELPAWLRFKKLVVWKRGFVETTHVTMSELLQKGAELFELCPILDLRIESAVTARPIPRGVFDTLSFLERLTTLRVGHFSWLHPPQDEDEFLEDIQAGAYLYEDFIAARVWKNLRCIDLSGYPVNDSWLLRFLADIPSASFAMSLRELDLSNCTWISDAGLSALADARSLGILERLNLKGSQPGRTTRRLLVRRFGDRVAF